MKFKIPLVLSFLFTINSAVAQNDSLERSICVGLKTQYSCAITEGDAEYFYMAYRASEQNDTKYIPYVTKLSDMGATLWKRPAFNSMFETGEVFQIAYDIDSNLLLSGYRSACDSSTGMGYVEKISKTDGTTIWLKQFDRFQHFGTGIISLPDSSYWVTDNENMLHLNAQGDSIGFSVYNLGRINRIVGPHFGHYILQCDSGLLRVDLNASAINAYYTNLKIEHVTLTDSNYFFYNIGTAIWRADTLLNYNLQYNLPANVGEVNAIVNNEERLWLVLRIKTTNTSRLLKLDYDLGFLAQHNFTYFNDSDMYARDILVNIHDYDLVYTEQLPQGNTLLLKSWAKTGNLTYKYFNDIALTELIADSAYADITISGFDTLVTGYAKLKAIVTNVGQHPVDSFYIHGLTPFEASNCTSANYVFKIDSVLLPGDSLEVDLNFLPTAPFNLNANPGLMLSYCFYTAGADGLMDYDHSNDDTCVTVTINTITAVDEPHKFSSILLYPNPVKDELHFQKVEDRQFAIRIFDVCGRCVKQVDLRDEDGKSCNVSELQQGIYFVEITGYQQQFRFVKM